MRKNSRQRNWILDYMNSHEGHYNAEAIYEGMAKEGYSVSPSTVYRNLKILEEDGIISSFMNKEGVKIYDRRMDPHDHFICLGCGQVLDTEVMEQLHLPEKIEQITQLPVEDVSLTAYYYCPDCRKERRG